MKEPGMGLCWGGGCAGMGGWQRTQEHPAGADAPQASRGYQQLVNQTLGMGASTALNYGRD